MNTGKITASAILICSVFAMLIGFFIGGEVIQAIYTDELHAIVENRATQAGAPSVSVSQNIADQRTNAIVRATRKVAPSVVGIVVTQIQVVRRPYGGDNFFDFFFNPDLRPPRYRKVENIGSGFIISDDGMILTNYHVVKNAARLYVNFPDGSRIEGKVIGTDEKSDLAVISAPGGGDFKTVQFGNSDKCMIGEWSIALGNPFLDFMNDAHPTVTVGVISAVNRNFAPSKGVYYQGMIQTDAAINLGNSGGPLVNALGEVIGVNSFIYTGSGAHTGSIGIGFAIPINRARRVADELIAHGHRRQVWTGLAVRDITNPVAFALNYNGEDGVVIIEIKPHSPGDAAGFRVGDIIHKMNDRPIHSSTDLDGIFLDYFVGDRVNIKYYRGGKQHSAILVLQEFPGGRRG